MSAGGEPPRPPDGPLELDISRIVEPTRERGIPRASPCHAVFVADK